MRLVADEGCDFAVVRTLRAAGHEVIAVAEISPRIPDEQVLELARKKNYVLITEDKDFGELVYARNRQTSGVVLLRFPGNARAAMARMTSDAIKTLGDKLGRRFTVIEPGKVRSREEAKG